MGSILTNQRPDFDSRNYGYGKLSELIDATTLFQIERRSPGDEQAGAHVRPREAPRLRHQEGRGDQEHGHEEQRYQEHGHEERGDRGDQ